MGGLTIGIGVYLWLSESCTKMYFKICIVWDEFVGMWLTLLLAPPGWAWILIGFCLFRTFDILKPWPINWVDKNVKGGLGIMLDDVLAGIMAVLCMQAIAILAS